MDLFFVSRARVHERPELYGRVGEKAVRRLDFSALPIVCRCSWTKNYRYSTNLQVVIDANSRLVVVIDLPLPGSRNDCRA